MEQALVGMELADIQHLLGAREPAYRARQLYEALYRQKAGDLADITTLPRELKLRLGSTHRVGLPGQSARYDSTDGTRRYLLLLDDGRSVETVLMPEGERNTICISSQVGCPVNCSFCLTARMGLERNLTAGEIVGQVLLVIEANGLSATEDRLNIVMMGQGEPLLNLANVLKATRILTDKAGMAFSERRITVSTAGIIPKIEELGTSPTRPKLAISLNASTEEMRQELMPITRKYHLRELLAACKRYPLRSWEKLTFEYVLLADVNDTDADARRVAKLLGNLNCKVNLIALNPGPGIPYGTPTDERVASFQEIVRAQRSLFCAQAKGPRCVCSVRAVEAHGVRRTGRAQGVILC